jgi:aryl-alcohol dehydrogenase-like predicted oxidoreductase
MHLSDIRKVITEGKEIQHRVLGKTGRKVGLFSLGGQSLIEDENKHDEAIEMINEALDKGVNYVDTAPAYGPKISEKVIGEAIKDRDRDFYLATKCDKRSNNSAWKQINQSIERLGTTPDCIQIHHLDHKWEVDKIFDSDGAIKALKRAKKEGLCKYLGITGHSDPTVLLDALKRYDFDTVLGAVNIADPYTYSFQARLIPYCKENNIGFIAMKVCAQGNIFRKNGINSMKDCLDYVWSIPGVSTAIIGIENSEQLNRNVALSKSHKQMPINKMRDLEMKVEPYHKDALFFRKGQEWAKKNKHIKKVF